MRFLSLVALAAVLALPASAQATFLVKGGLNTAFLTGDLADGLDPRLGAVAGAGVRFDLTRSVSLQAEALYSQKGAEDKDIVDPGTYRLDYLEVPVLVRFAVPVSPYADAGLYAGPSIGIPIGAEFRSDDSEALDIDYDGDLKTDIGLALGADFWSGPVGIDVRYVAGLSDVFEDGRGLRDVRNGALQLTLGLRFGGGRY
ncbi:porin family protein [Rubrivirga sp. IMCC45206]|uniref:porin family protein n=1 Tax=Rubrivirga sp. IMCC45206 TaxID=3391614 RepID=UPI00398FB4CB